MQKIVINNRHGGFSISEAGVRWLRQNNYNMGEEFTLPGEYYDDGSGPANDLTDAYYGPPNLSRDNMALVDLVNESDVDYNGSWAELKVVEVPDNVDWEIKEREGYEWVAEEHRTWS